MVRKLSIFCLSIWLALSAAAAFDSRDLIFSPRFKSLKTSVLDNFMSPPVIRLNTDDRIVVSFDEIAEDNSFLEYRLLHCNADWLPSRLVESEYIDGFNSQRIEDFAFSTATFIHYVNYRIELPNDNCRLLWSGNYLLQVYDPDNPDNVLLQTRFQVSENSTAVTGAASSRTDRGHNSQWQQLAFAVNTEAMGDVNPYQDFSVIVGQNLDGSSDRLIKSPLRVSPPDLIYEHMPELIFPAGNEFRRFEVVSTAFPGMHVDSLRYVGPNYHVWLKPDYDRSSRQYSYDRTQHGRFLVREYNASDSDIAADYVTVHFTLFIQEIPGSEIYVDGEFCHGIYDRYNQMSYNREIGAYTAEIPLKQGAYNYRYILKSDHGASPPLDSAPVEGNFFETDNEYTVRVWFHPPGARADRLVGFSILSPL